MFCPVCRNVELFTTGPQGLVDYCLSCRGVWLDRARLDALIEAADPVGALRPTFDEPAALPMQPRTGRP